MQGLKKTGLVVSILLFSPLFLLSLLSFTFGRTLGDLTYAKQVVDEAGFYEAAGDAIVNQAAGEAGGDPIISAALETAVSGDQLQRLLEPLIEGIYGWLDGTTEQPEFSLAIEPIKSTFQTSLTGTLQALAASLPACTQASEFSGEDIYTYTCIPPGTDVNAAINDAVSRVITNASLFSDQLVADGTISANDAAEFGINDPSQNLPNSLPMMYQFLIGGQWFFIAGTVLMTIGVVLLSKAWLFGLRKLGILLVINGVMVLVTGFLFGFVGGSLIPTTSVEVTESTVNALEKAARVILVDTASMQKLAGIITFVLGVIAIIVSTVILNKQKPQPVAEREMIDARHPR